MEGTRQKANADMSENCGSLRVQLTPTGSWNGDTLRDLGWIECIAGFGPYQKATSVSSVTSTYSLSALLSFFFSTLTGKPSFSLPLRAASCHRIGGRLSWICLTLGKPHNVMRSAFDMFSRETASFMKSALSTMSFFFLILRFHCIYYFLCQACKHVSGNSNW